MDATAKEADTITYAGHSRFTLELELVQALSNPFYLHHLARKYYFDDPCFVKYLDYLQYWRKPEYAKYLSYPAITLRVLELLQVESFRTNLLQERYPAEVAQTWFANVQEDAKQGDEEQDGEEQDGDEQVNDEA